MILQRFGDHFEIKDESTKLQFHSAVFGTPERMLERFSHVPINPSLALPLKHLPSPVAFLGPLVGHELSLLAKDGDSIAALECEVRRTEDYTGAVHPSGFALTFSKAMPEDGVVHYMNAEIDVDSKAELPSFPDLWTFLATCRPDASVEFDQLVLPVRNVGNLTSIGFFARYLRRAYPLHDWPGGTWLLPDVLAEETLNTLAWLTQTNETAEWLTGQGFVLDHTSEYTEEAAELLVPVCANLPRQGVIVWLDMEGSLFHDGDGTVCGVRLGTTRSRIMELRSKRFEMSNFPEVVIRPNWPTIRLSPEELSLGEPPRDWGCEFQIRSRIV